MCYESEPECLHKWKRWKSEREKEGILVLCVFKVFSLDTNADEAR